MANIIYIYCSPPIINNVLYCIVLYCIVLYSSTPRYLFWTDLQRGNRIQRSSLTGKNVVHLITTALYVSDAIAADHATKKIFFVNRNDIESAGYDGNNRIRLVRNSQAYFFDISVFQVKYISILKSLTSHSLLMNCFITDHKISSVIMSGILLFVPLAVCLLFVPLAVCLTLTGSAVCWITSSVLLNCINLFAN